MSKEIELRSRSYFEKTKKVLQGLSAASAMPRLVSNSETELILRESKRYLEDSEFYLGKGDFATSLVCVSYCEGLLDCMRLLGILEFQW